MAQRGLVGGPQRELQHPTRRQRACGLLRGRQRRVLLRHRLSDPRARSLLIAVDRTTRESSRTRYFETVFRDEPAQRKSILQSKLFPSRFERTAIVAQSRLNVVRRGQRRDTARRRILAGVGTGGQWPAQVPLVRSGDFA